MAECKLKNFVVSVKSATDAGGFEGVLSTYGNIDAVGDVCERGCFDVSLATKGSRRPLLWQHDQTCPIGSFEAFSDDNALYVKGRFNLDVEKGREGFALLKAGDIDGLSIGYVAIDYEWDRDGIRHLKQVDLLEGSLVTFPANELARAQAKSIERKARIMKFAQLKSVQALDEETRKAILEELAEADEEEKAEDIPAEEEPKEEEKSEPVDEDKPEEDQTEADLKAEIERLKEEFERMSKALEKLKE
jgi:HK97 family phage prohead protease